MEQHKKRYYLAVGGFFLPSRDVAVQLPQRVKVHREND